jgi:hypothetical protein
MLGAETRRLDLRMRALDAADASPMGPDAGSSPDPLCEQICAAVDALDCTFGKEPDCQMTCLQGHAGPCGDLVRAMEACLLAADGWFCLEGVKVDRDLCPNEVLAVEDCQHPPEDAGVLASPPPDSEMDAGAPPDAPPTDSMSGAPNDAGHDNDATSDASDAGPSDASMQGPDGSTSPLCVAYCEGQQAVECAVKLAPDYCRASCEADEAGPCGPIASRLHACVVADEQPWACVAQAAVGLAENVCASEGLDFILCLSSL